MGKTPSKTPENPIFLCQAQGGQN